MPPHGLRAAMLLNSEVLELDAVEQDKREVEISALLRQASKATDICWNKWLLLG